MRIYNTTKKRFVADRYNQCKNNHLTTHARNFYEPTEERRRFESCFWLFSFGKTTYDKIS